MSEEKPVWGQGAACPHKPQWHCENHGECRGCECGCDTVNPPLEELEEADRHLGEKDLVHHPQGRRPMTAADLAAMHTRHANAIVPIPSATALGHEHLMAHADRGTLLAELNREMERVSDLEAEVELLNLKAVQSESGAHIAVNAGVTALQEVGRLEGVLEAARELHGPHSSQFLEKQGWAYCRSCLDIMYPCETRKALDR